MGEQQVNSLAYILKIIIHLYLETLSHETWLLKAGPFKADHPGWNISKDGEPTTSVSNLFCCLTNQRVKSFLVFKHLPALCCLKTPQGALFPII